MPQSSGENKAYKNFFRLRSALCLISVHCCEDHSHLHLLN